jgi:NADH-quinone oxidoreductase subunit M
MGAYGFLRISLPILPDATQTFLLPMQIISGIAIVYGAYVTLTQTDIKRLIAYSSVSHMGFVTLGIFSLNQNGVEGAVLQMVNHGIVTGGLFLCIGMIYERTHTRDLAAYGGLAKAAPVYMTFFTLFSLAAAGTPGLNSFIGEFLIISGGFRAHTWLGAMGVWGVGLGTTYMLWLLYRVGLGEVTPTLKEHRHGLDLNGRELATLIPLALLVVLIGVYPESFLGFMRASVTQLLGSMSSTIMVRGL